VQLHLNPADTFELFGHYLPFSTFTIAFQEITTSGKFDDLPERICR
jgi:hypothetical protein